MEASNVHQQKEKEPRVHRPCAFDKMEGLVREMQDPENGVPVRSQKQFLTSIPSAFMGYDLIEWLMERLAIEESVEAVHIANQLCQYGYFFPVNDSKTLTVKDDGSLYRFQTPYYWPWQHRTPDNVEYAIYLAKRTLRNKQRHALEDYEIEALNSLRKNLQNKWDIIQLQAEEQVRLSKERKKGDKIVSDSQERAFWRVYRPPPGCSSSLEIVPVPTRARPGLPRLPARKRTLTDLQREVDLLRNSLTRTRIKMSTAIENLRSHFETYMEYDPMIVQPQPSNPWITDDQTFWQLNSPLVEVPTEKRVKRWALSMEEIMSDPTGLQEFTNYLRKEYSHENIRFWLAVKDLRHSFQAQIAEKVNEIFREFLAPGAPCEINIDGKTMEKVHQEMKNPSRFTFDSAAEHVYTLLLKKDCYPRFIRSDHYRNLLAAGVQPLQKKRFFVFGGQAKKKMSSTTTPMPSLQQQHSSAMSSGTGRRRGSDRSLSGSAHELAVCGVRDVSSTPRVPHSHSQSNLTDIPYRNVAGVGDPGALQHMDDVCPWDLPGPSNPPEPHPAPVPAPASNLTPTAGASAATSLHHPENSPWDLNPARTASSMGSRKNSSQLDSCSSSSDVSLAIAEASERLKKSCAVERTPINITRNLSMGSTTLTTTTKVKLIDTNRGVSISTCNFPSPQQSFDLFAEKPEDLEAPARQGQAQGQAQAPQAVPETSNPGSRRIILSPGKAPLISISAIVGELDREGDTDVSLEEDPGDNGANENAESCKKKVSFQTDLEEEEEEEEDLEDLEDLEDPGDPEDPEEGEGNEEKPGMDLEAEGEEREEEEEEKRRKGEEEDEGVQEHPRNPRNPQDRDPRGVGFPGDDPGGDGEEEQLEEAQVVPVWEPDAQKREDQEAQGELRVVEGTTGVPTSTTTTATTSTATQEQRDNNVNEVCPWEDEENCRVDSTYVKTYATLGYL